MSESDEMLGVSFQVLIRHVADLGRLHFTTFGKERSLRVRFPLQQSVSMLRCSPFLFADFASLVFKWFVCSRFNMSLHSMLPMYMTFHGFEVAFIWGSLRTSYSHT